MMVAAMITGGTTSGSTLTATNVAEASARLAKADAAEDQLGVPAAPDAKFSTAPEKKFGFPVTLTSPERLFVPRSTLYPRQQA